MSRYSDAGEVAVSTKNPLINEEEGTHICEVLSVFEGDSKKTGLPFMSTELKVLQSETLPAGAKLALLCNQKTGKGARNYYLQDVKKVVGGALNISPNDVTGDNIDSYIGPQAVATGTVVAVRVYSKPPNPQGKVFKEFQCTHVE